MKNLKAIRLEIEGSFNSFRFPKSLKYHKTFNVPTKTTLIGLLGSALGYDGKELFSLYSFILTNSILDSFSGFVTDLWLITKLKTEAETESSPIIREMLYKPTFFIYYSIDDKQDTDTNEIIKLNDISKAFADPFYALSLGRSNDLIRIKKIEEVDLYQQSSSGYYFKNTIFPFDYKSFFDKFESMTLIKGQAFSLPQVITIPTSYRIEEGFVRRASQFKKITMIYDRGISLKNNDAWTDGKQRLFLY